MSLVQDQVKSTEQLAKTAVSQSAHISTSREQIYVDFSEGDFSDGSQDDSANASSVQYTQYALSEKQKYLPQRLSPHAVAPGHNQAQISTHDTGATIHISDDDEQEDASACKASLAQSKSDSDPPTRKRSATAMTGSLASPSATRPVPWLSHSSKTEQRHATVGDLASTRTTQATPSQLLANQEHAARAPTHQSASFLRSTAQQRMPFPFKGVTERLDAQQDVQQDALMTTQETVQASLPPRPIADSHASAPPSSPIASDMPSCTAQDESAQPSASIQDRIAAEEAFQERWIKQGTELGEACAQFTEDLVRLREAKSRVLARHRQVYVAQRQKLEAREAGLTQKLRKTKEELSSFR